MIMRRLLLNMALPSLMLTLAHMKPRLIVESLCALVHSEADPLSSTVRALLVQCSVSWVTCSPEKLQRQLHEIEALSPGPHGSSAVEPARLRFDSVASLSALGSAHFQGCPKGKETVSEGDLLADCALLKRALLKLPCQFV